MQEPTDPSLAQPATGEAQTDQAKVIPSDGEGKTASQNSVPANYVEISQIALEKAEKKKENVPAPDARLSVTMGGTPVKKTELTSMVDLLRADSGRIRACLVTCPEDGIIDVFTSPYAVRGDGLSIAVPSRTPLLYKSLVLPDGITSFHTTRELFDSIVALLQKHVMLTTKECSLVAYWSMATWFADLLPFLPCLAISGPPSTADRLLRTLVAVCRRPVALADVSPAVLRALPLSELTPTLLIREPRLNKRTAAWLDASNQPGYLFLAGQDFQQLYCPKCIYVGERCEDQLLARNSIQMHVGGNSVRPFHQPPTADVINDFQSRLLTYRLLGRDKVTTSKFRVSAFRPEFCAMAEVLGAAIVDDPELQRGIIDLLQDRDELSRVDRASGLNGMVLRAVLFHCHQKDQQKVFVRDIAATVNGICKEEGESLKVSSETVGHALKNLGLYSRRLGNGGKGLMLDKSTQSRAHELSHAYEVLPVVPGCGHCQKLQLQQSQEVV